MNDNTRLSLATREALKYEEETEGADCTIINGAFTTGDLAVEAYCAGRTAPVTETEIKAAVQYVKDSAANFFGTPAVSKVSEHRLRKFTRGILNAARKAVDE